MSKQSVGIYLGSDHVDIVCLSGSPQSPKLVTYGRSQLPDSTAWKMLTQIDDMQDDANTQDDPDVHTVANELSSDDISAISAAIQTLLNKVGISHPQVTLAIPSESVIIRYFQMPMIPAHERKLAVAFEAKKYLPFKLDELETDFEVVTHKNDPTLMRVMFFGIKRNTLSTYMSLLDSMNLQPTNLEPAPLSLIRVAQHSGQLGDDQVAVILSLEHGTANINIAKSNLLYLSRNVSAKTQFSNYGLGDVPPLLESLIRETRVSIDYYRRRFLGEPSVAKVIVYGQDFNDTDLEELKNALDVPVEIGNPFAKIGDSDNSSPGLACATGLALLGLDPKAAGLNLLPRQYRKQKVDMGRPLMFEAIAGVLILVAWFALAKADVGKLKDELQMVRSKTAQINIPQKNGDYAQLQKYKSELSKTRQMLDQFKGTTRDNSQFLFDIAQLMPDSIWLEHVTIETNLIQDKKKIVQTSRLQLEGAAYTGDADREFQFINQFLSKLRGSESLNDNFVDFQLENVERNTYWKENISKFKLTCSTGNQGANTSKPGRGRKRTSRR